MKSLRQALCGVSLPARDEKLLVVASSLEAEAEAGRGDGPGGGICSGVYTHTQCTQFINKIPSRVPSTYWQFYKYSFV